MRTFSLNLVLDMTVKNVDIIYVLMIFLTQNQPIMQ